MNGKHLPPLKRSLGVDPRGARPFVHDPAGLARLRRLPSVNSLLDRDEGARLVAVHARAPVVEALRRHLEILRRDAAPFDAETFFAGVEASLTRPGLRRVVNATGIVIHTNLGRAPLAEEALAAVAEVAAGACDLEYDLDAGRRGGRGAALLDLVADMAGGEAALVVNNNAAAVLLAVAAMAGGGGEAVVSRGELVEIGGSFRIPDIIAQGGARLVEVGTTNKTRVADYARAMGERTRLLLKVHQSNYRIVGFTAAPDRADLAALGAEAGVPVVEDLGSGTLLDLRHFGLPHEPTVGECLEAGMDLVTFSGDKLLGGPQAGIIVGRRDLVERLRTHPLTRAVRCDKMTLAALDATLRLYRDPARAVARVPVLRALAAPLAAVEARAEALRQVLGAGQVVSTEAFVGGGAMPEAALPSAAVAMPGLDAAALRRASVPVIGRVSGGCLLLDARTMSEADFPAVAAAVEAASC